MASANVETGEDDEEFIDTVENLTDLSGNEANELNDIILSVGHGLDLFLNNKFEEAKKIFFSQYEKSPYHALGYGTLMFLQAIMTFEQENIDIAAEVMKKAVEVCNVRRRKGAFIEVIYKNKNVYDVMTTNEVHAELCYAEALLEQAMLTFIQDENLLSFIKGGLKVKSCFAAYRESSRINKNRKWKSTDHCLHFQSGISMGIGSFNLMISLLPAKILKLLEFVGFKGSRIKGLKELETGANLENSLRSPLCSMVLITYHTMVSYVLGIGDSDLLLAEKFLNRLLERYPEGAIILFFTGRLEELKGNFNKAIERLEESINSQNIWKQFHHFCYWELMWCHCYKMDWLFAMKYAERLLNESRWSRATYAYQKASFMLMCIAEDPSLATSTKEHISYLMQEVPKLKQRIAGKSLPVEKFAVKKAELYFDQKNHLVLPGYELMYIWNGFLILAKCPNLVHNALKTIKETKDKLITGEFRYYDNLALLLLLEGTCLRHLTEYRAAEILLKEVLAIEKEVKDDKYLIPSAQFELGMVYMQQLKLDDAKEAFDKTRKDYKGYMLESRIHFRLQAATLHLKHLRNPELDSMSLSSDEFADATVELAQL